MTGSDLKKLREEFGLSAEEFARHLASIEAPITTGRSIYRLEARNRVPRWCVEALREYVGDDAFRRALADLGVADAEGAPTTERDFKVATRRGRRNTQKDSRRQRQEGDYIALLTALPLVTRTVPWITTFRDALREFLGDVDRVSINVNHNCDIHRTGQSHSDIIIAEHVDSPTEGSTVFVTLEEDEGVPSERLMREFREKGYPLDSYHDPYGTDYFVDGSYLGTVFLWRDCGSPAISESTIELFERLRPFIIFSLMNVVALQRSARPFDQAFADALAFMRHDASLSEQESRVAILQLYGHSYKEIAERLAVALDTVRTHIRSIHRKTGTRSSAELFAKYFTQRLGI